MQTLKPTEIAQVGEKLVEEWLSENGFIHVAGKPGPSNDGNVIEANGSIENILVHVKTTMRPAGPEKISEDERSHVKKIAENGGRKAYVAYVVIDSDKNVVGEISWQRLS